MEHVDFQKPIQRLTNSTEADGYIDEQWQPTQFVKQLIDGGILVWENGDLLEVSLEELRNEPKWW